ncbi:hypothetical protein GF367_04555 [Candidatus Woesearchaeota archaeon]|nr:hypothetical protein [Candidatus Woesearchaeota archaeon]
MPFCPKCGKRIPHHQTFCDEHRPVRLEVKPFDIRVCGCGALFAHNRWMTPKSMEASAAKLIKEHIKQKATVNIVSLPLPEKRGQKTEGEAVATYEGEDYPLTFTVKQQRCDKCARKGTHYYTAKLQLRDPPAGALGFIEEAMQPLAAKGVSINKVEETPRGPDLYVTHKAAARQLADKLVRKYGGTMKTSEQLFSRNKQTSKNVYRLNVVVAFAHFTVGDVLVVDKKVVAVTGVGKRCTGRDLSTSKKIIFSAGDEQKKLEKHKTTVTITHPSVEVIHPKTFQSVVVRNHEPSLPSLKNGQDVHVVVDSKHVFLAEA